jgi:hypothetical protein
MRSARSAVVAEMWAMLSHAQALVIEEREQQQAAVQR